MRLDRTTSNKKALDRAKITRTGKIEKKSMAAPNPAGAPGRFALTEVKANRAPTGTTNISAKISGDGYMTEAAVMTKKAAAISQLVTEMRMTNNRIARDRFTRRDI